MKFSRATTNFLSILMPTIRAKKASECLPYLRDRKSRGKISKEAQAALSELEAAHKVEEIKGGGK